MINDFFNSSSSARLSPLQNHDFPGIMSFPALLHIKNEPALCRLIFSQWEYQEAFFLKILPA